MKAPPLKNIQLTEAEHERLNRRGFMKAAAIGTGSALGIWGLSRLEEDRGTPWLLRRANEAHDSFWKANFSTKTEARPVNAAGVPIRTNGDIGLLKQVDEAAYRLMILDDNFEGPFSLRLEQIKNLPAVTESFEFKCIEGWAQPVSCKGVRFSDFMHHYEIGGGYAFAGFTTIDRGYYVSWDMKSLLHPQTILCYEMNERPLKPENGAPLRLLSSVKYGVKQIKQVGTIAFADTAPADYWAERGYSEYLGL